MSDPLLLPWIHGFAPLYNKVLCNIYKVFNFNNQVVEMGGVQTLIFLSQSGNEEVKVSSLLVDY